MPGLAPTFQEAGTEKGEGPAVTPTPSADTRGILWAHGNSPTGRPGSPGAGASRTPSKQSLL